MIEITTQDEWTTRLDHSNEVPFFVFKHSTTCPISARAKDRVDIFLSSAPENSPEIALVKVIESRPISNAITSAVGVVHQSPQLILVKEGKGVWNASHHLIQPESIEEAIAAHLA
jgi:bacillithiol system protein YtxJ